MIPLSVLKAAYRRALLKHHPDKTGSTAAADLSSQRCSLLESSFSTQSARFTVDEITLAYTILSNSESRAKYDRALRLKLLTPQPTEIFDANHIGFETIDLDDMQCDENPNGGSTTWSRGCRCGSRRGFVIREEDLGRALEETAGEIRDGGTAEIVVGCTGCSLVLKVCFGVVEEG